MKIKYKGQVCELMPPRALSDLISHVLEFFQISPDSKLEATYQNSESIKTHIFTEGDYSLALLEMGDRVCFHFKLLQQAPELDSIDFDLELLMGYKQYEEQGLIAAIDKLAEEPVSEFRKALLKRCNGPEFNLTTQMLYMIGKIQSQHREPTSTTPLLCKEAMMAFISGRRSKPDIIKEFDVNPDKFEEWIQIFSGPTSTDFGLLCYPENFAIELMKDYLKGYYSAQQVATYFSLPLEVLHSWIRQAGERRILQQPDPKSLDAVLAKLCLEAI